MNLRKQRVWVDVWHSNGNVTTHKARLHEDGTLRARGIPPILAEKARIGIRKKRPVCILRAGDGEALPIDPHSNNASLATAKTTDEIVNATYISDVFLGLRGQRLQNFVNFAIIGALVLAMLVQFWMYSDLNSHMDALQAQLAEAHPPPPPPATTGGR